MNEPSSPPSRYPLPCEWRPHRATEEEMLLWCEEEGITPVRDELVGWDWAAALKDYEAKCVETSAGYENSFYTPPFSEVIAFLKYGAGFPGLAAENAWAKKRADRAMEILLSAPEIIFGEIPADREYLLASVTAKDGQFDIARLAPADQTNPEQGRFVLDWIIGDTGFVDRELRIGMTDSLELLLLRKGEPKPWAYLCHHCTTASNLYSRESGDVWWSVGAPPG